MVITSFSFMGSSVNLPSRQPCFFVILLNVFFIFVLLYMLDCSTGYYYNTRWQHKVYNSSDHFMYWTVGRPVLDRRRAVVSGLVQRRPAPRRGFRGGCCQPTALRRLCRQPNDRMSTRRPCWPFVSRIRER